MDSIKKRATFQHTSASAKPTPHSYIDEPLWSGIPVCTVHCKEKHLSSCPDHENSTRLFDRSIKLPISNACVDLIKYSVGDDWKLMASSLGFTNAEIQELQDDYIRGDEGLYNEMRDRLPDYVFLIEAMVRKSLIDKNMSPENFFNAIENSGHFEKKIYLFREVNDHSKIPVNPFPHNSGYITSYIFLIWIKKDKKSLALPNTDDCPVKQRCYDWAQHNKDKLVVLWYSSSKLDSEEEKKALYDFQKKSLYDGITNILILDVDKIDWGNEERYTFRHKGHKGKCKISEILAFDDKKPFSDVIDSFRPALLSRGSSSIKSAMQQSHIAETQIPTRGAYFDIDYLPIPFEAFYHPYRQICRDGTFDKIVFFNGKLCVLGMIPNSFLASDEDNNEILNEYPLADAYGELSFYTSYKPHLVATTRIFRMSDCQYRDDGSLIEWERQATWEQTYSDKKISRLVSKDKPSLPEYLPKYLASSSSKSDQMVR